MDILDQADQLQRVGKGQHAIALIVKAADADDPLACLALANWRIFGVNGTRDLTSAHQWLRRSRAGGNIDATRLLAALLANGTGCEPDPEQAEQLLETIAPVDDDAALQLRLLAAMRERRHHSADVAMLDPELPILQISHALTDDECAYLIRKSRAHLRPSQIIDPLTGKHRPDPVRRSNGMMFGPTLEDCVVAAINRRIAELTDTHYLQGEPLHMLCYDPGDEYRPHVDTLPATTNQRIKTVLLYLNDAYDGGETEFIQLKRSLSGLRGDALIFSNVDAHGLPHLRSLHAGRPVLAGQKWLATRWIRANPYRVLA